MIRVYTFAAHVSVDGLVAICEEKLEKLWAKLRDKMETENEDQTRHVLLMVAKMTKQVALYIKLGYLTAEDPQCSKIIQFCAEHTSLLSMDSRNCSKTIRNSIALGGLKDAFLEELKARYPMTPGSAGRLLAMLIESIYEKTEEKREAKTRRLENGKKPGNGSGMGMDMDYGSPAFTSNDSLMET